MKPRITTGSFRFLKRKTEVANQIDQHLWGSKPRTNKEITGFYAKGPGRIFQNVAEKAN